MSCSVRDSVLKRMWTAIKEDIFIHVRDYRFLPECPVLFPQLCESTVGMLQFPVCSPPPSPFSQTHKSPDDAMLTITLHQVQHLAQYLVTTIVKLICYQTEVARGREMSAVGESLASYD